MSAARNRSSRAGLFEPERAVIDIGSNTVRMVIYAGPRRAPVVWMNEKVTARLGRELGETGQMPEQAIELALQALARYAAIIADIGVKDIDVVATAAVREAANGPEFADRVRAMGLDIRVLSGEEEAEISAFGVIGAFPGAHGVVADLGGGSLELVSVAEGECHDGISLPLGTLRLPALRADGQSAFRKAVGAMLDAAGWAKAHSGPLYMVGGTWRALANVAMHERNYPLTDPQAFALGAKEADGLAKRIAKMPAEKLRNIGGISPSRAEGLPDAAALVRVLIDELEPDGLVFSSWGLREGVLFRQLDRVARGQDPLLSAIAHFAEPRGASTRQAAHIAAWTAAAANGGGNGNERLRVAATMLAMAAARIEPNMRLTHSTDWALHKRWLGLDHRGRGMLAAALGAACGQPEPPEALRKIASEADLREAAGWGLAIRLCRRLGAGSRLSLLTSRLTREAGTLALWIDPQRAELVAGYVESDLRALAQWLGLDWALDNREILPVT